MHFTFHIELLLQLRYFYSRFRFLLSEQISLVLELLHRFSANRRLLVCVGVELPDHLGRSIIYCASFRLLRALANDTDEPNMLAT